MRHMDPPKRSKGKKAKQATKATKANAGRQKPMPSRGGRAVKGPPPEPRMTVAEHQEDLTATCCELATALGCKTVETGPSRYFINPENGRIVELAANGLLFEAELARKSRA